MYEYLGTDILVVDRDFSVVPTGDVDVCTGTRCLLQGLVHRLGTPRGDLWMHPDYGLDIYRFLHVEANAVQILDFQQSVAEEVEKDPRVEPGSTVVKVVHWEIDRVEFRLTVRPIGTTNPLNLVLGYDLQDIRLEVVHVG